MIQLQVCFCLLGLALAALGVAMLLRPQSCLLYTSDAADE